MQSVGNIGIHLNADTGKFEVDLARAKGAIRGFGESSVGSTRAAALGFRELSGAIEGNSRGAAMFLINVLKLGDAVKVMLPVIAGIAFAGMIVELGQKVEAFVKKIKEMPDKIADSFSAMSESLRVQGDELDLNNARLDKEIAKFSGKPTNNLAVAFEEARLAADKLAESARKAMQESYKTLSDDAPKGFEYFLEGLAERLAGGMPSKRTGEMPAGHGEKADIWNTGDIAGYLGGAHGRGGDAAKLRDADIARQMADAKTEADDSLTAKQKLEAKKKSTAVYYAALLDIYTTEQAVFITKLHNLQKADPNSDLPETAATTEALTDLIKTRTLLMTNAQKEIRNASKEETLGALKDAAAARIDPVGDFINKLKAQVAGAHAELEAVGQSHHAEVLAKGLRSAGDAAEELKVRLKEMHLSEADIDKKIGPNSSLFKQVLALYQDNDLTKDQTAWGEKIEDNIKKLKEETYQQTQLAAAIGHGYEQVKAATVEAEVYKAMGPEQYDPTSEKASKLRTAGNAAYDAKNKTQADQLIFNLHEQITLENELAAAQSQGAAALRLVNQQESNRQILLHYDFLTAVALIKANNDLFDAKEKNNTDKELEALQLKVAATERLANAIGIQAKREAELKNIEAEGKIKNVDPKVTAAEVALKQAQEQAKIQEGANNLLTEYADKVQKIIEYEDEINKSKASQTEKDVALRSLELERLDIEIKHAEALGTAKGALEEFFAEMKKDSMESAKVLYDALHNTLDKVSDEMGRLLTGQIKNKDIGKEFGKMFQEMGAQVVTASTKKLMETGLGELSKHIPGLSGITSAMTKKDGQSEAAALWVRISGQGQGGGAGSTGNIFRTPQEWQAGQGFPGRIAPPNIAPDLSNLSNMQSPFANLPGMSAYATAPAFDAAAGAGADALSTLPDFAGMLAEGGDVDPGHVYGVGDNGLELFHPSTPGTVTPLSKMGGGGDTHNYTIDARGSQFGTENRIARSIEMSHQAAVTNSLRASADRKERTPQRK